MNKQRNSKYGQVIKCKRKALFFIALATALYITYKINPNLAESIRIDKSQINVSSSIKQIGRLCKILNNEYKRILLEVLIYIPVGIMGGFAFERRKTIKTVLVVLMGGLIFGAAKIKWTLLIYIGQTVLHNIIGTVVGISLYFLVSYCIRKASIWKRVLCLIVPSIMLMYITIQYIICCTNVWGNVFESNKTYILPDSIQIRCSDEYEMRKIDCHIYSSYTQKEINEIEEKIFDSVGISAYNTCLVKNKDITQISIGIDCRKSTDLDGRYLFAVQRPQPRKRIIFLDTEKYNKVDETQHVSEKNVLNKLDINSEEVNYLLRVLQTKLGIKVNPKNNLG